VPKTPTTVLIAVALLSGCVTANTVLDANGGGTMTLSYRLPVTSSVDQERKKAAGPDVVVERAARVGTNVELHLKFADVRKLDTSRTFKNFHASFDDHVKGQRTLIATVDNPLPVTFPEAALDKVGREVKLTLQLPDEVLESTGKKTAPNTVVWEMPTNDLVSVRQRELRVTYRRPEAPAPAKAQKPAPKAAASKPPAKKDTGASRR
jgi:hypothetical protein